MPTYAYRCTMCSHELEVKQSFSDDALTICPDCGGALRKLFSSVGVVFKGSGFYRNDARSSTSGGSGSSSRSGGSTSSSGSDAAASSAGGSDSGASAPAASGSGSGGSASTSGSSTAGAKAAGSAA